MLFFLKKKLNPPVLKMVVPGRRALGEAWSEVTVRPREDGGFDLENRPAEVAPADGAPVIVPAMANLSEDEVNFILEGALKRQEYTKNHPRQQPVSDDDFQKWAQEMWTEYLEAKIKFLRGVTVSGPGGWTQREKPPVQEWNPRV